MMKSSHKKIYLSGTPKCFFGAPWSYFGLTLVYLCFINGLRIFKRLAFSRIFLGFCFVAGLVLSGSDGIYFPWLNLLGVVLFGWPVVAANIIEIRKGEGE